MTQPIGPDALASGDLRLRVWFSDGIHDFERLAPDQSLSSVPFALVAASLTENPVFSGNVGIGVDSPSAPLDVAGRINATSLSIKGIPALELTDSGNAFFGRAGNGSAMGSDNVGVGWVTLEALTTGVNNTAVGAWAMLLNTTGSSGTALGMASLLWNTSGDGNTALGQAALLDNTTGSRNIGIGLYGGRHLTTGNDNIAIGNVGVAGESGVIRIGSPGTHHTTHIAGTVEARRFRGDGSGLHHVRGTLISTYVVKAWGGDVLGKNKVPSGLSDVMAIDAGNMHTVALKGDGTVVAWGANESGQTMVPVGLSEVAAIAAGFRFTVALKQDGTVVAWGSNFYGETTVPTGLSDVIAIAAGLFHTVALKRDGTVVAWGANDKGQTTVPAGLSEVTAIAAGNHFTIVSKRDGSVMAWGNNAFGQTTVPSGLSGVSAIAAGADHAVALKQDGTVVAWGWNYFGQTQVPSGLSEVTAIDAGHAHTVALKEDGTVAAWGWNDDDQTTVPSDLSNAIGIAAGTVHTVALVAASQSIRGQLEVTGNVGIGTASPSTPLDVAGRINATSLSLKGNLALELPGSANVFVGSAGNTSTTTFNTLGVGWAALQNVTSGFNNTAVGAYALRANTTGNLGTALGVASLWGNTEGLGNTALGHDALHANTTGSRNIGLGLDGGRNLTTGNDNIAIGNTGVAGESGVIRIGSPGTHHTTYLAGTVLTTSDRDAKRDLTSVDPESVLSKVAGLPISEWSFEKNPSTRHMGPMAQDFHAAFGLGLDNRHIATVDADGVALAAIQGLYRTVLAQKAQLTAQESELASQSAAWATTPQHRSHRCRRSGLEGCRLQRLHRHQDAQHRRARRRGREADAVLRPADVHAHPGRADDRPLSFRYGLADRRHPRSRRLRPRHRRCLLPQCLKDARATPPPSSASGTSATRQEVLAEAARLRLPVRRDDRRAGLLHAQRRRGARLVPQQRAGPRGGLHHHSSSAMTR
jgi:hypothetical protein